MENTKLNTMLVSRLSLNKALVKELGLSEAEVAEYQAALKAAKAQDKLDKIKLEKCIIEYTAYRKTCTMNFKPSLCKTDKGEFLIIWRTADKNGILVARRGKEIDAEKHTHEIELDLVPCCATNSTQYVWRKSLIAKTKTMVENTWNPLFSGLTWEAFFSKVHGYIGVKTTACPKALKSL